jgi:hypothetical protein
MLTPSFSGYAEPALATGAGDGVRIAIKAAVSIPGDGLPLAGLYALLYATN